MANLASRRSFKWIHTWMGLTAGLVIAVVSLTGGIVVFRTEIQMASVRRGADSPRIARLDQVVQEVASSRPDAQVRRVRFPAHAGEPFIVQVEAVGKPERLVCDASTGRVLGALKTGATEWMIDLHRNLLAGKTGRKSVGIVGIVLFLLAATGMWLWLSGARSWQAWISVRPQGRSRRFHFELHRAAGLWSYVLLALVSFTGIGLSYPDAFRAALQFATGGQTAAKAPRVGGSTAGVLRPLAEYLAAGRQALPDGEPTEMRLPEKSGAPVDLRFHRAGDLAPSGNHVYLDPSTASVMAVSRLVDQPLGTRIFSVFSPLHYGEFGGLPVKLIWALLGLAPSVLFVTGLMTWWRPRRRKATIQVREEFALVSTSRV